MAKQAALILHGWPQHNIRSHFLCRYFDEKGYRILAPDLFTKKYEFTAGNITDEIKKQLGSIRLNAIVGISLGGLIAPYLAKEYPESKLVFIASGAKVRSKSRFFNFLLRVFRRRIILYMVKPFLYMPGFILEFFYKLGSPFNGPVEQEEKYILDMKQNIKLIKNIPVSEEAEILDFVYNTNNTKLLSTLKNETLIFSGSKDLLMPVQRGRELNKLIQNSRLIINESEHFNTFTVDNLKELDSFLM